MSFKAQLPSSPTKAAAKPPAYGALFDLFSINLSPPTLLLLGATLQVLLSLLPIRPLYSLLPAVILISLRTIDTILITYGLKPNPYLKDAILKKSALLMPDKNGNYGAPGSEKIAVLLLGAKSNHPLGVFAPGFKDLGDYMGRMNDELEADLDQSLGYLGKTSFTRTDSNGATEIMTIYYWRTIQDVHNYAHGKIHREAIVWWNKTVREHNHIGIMHEVFEADKGMWEGVYANFQPTMMGATTVLKRGGKMEGGVVEDEWVTPLVEGNRGVLKSSNGRRGLRDSAEVKKMWEGEAEGVYDF